EPSHLVRIDPLGHAGQDHEGEQSPSFATPNGTVNQNECRRADGEQAASQGSQESEIEGGEPRGRRPGLTSAWERSVHSECTAVFQSRSAQTAMYSHSLLMNGLRNRSGCSVLAPIQTE